jgi:ABC-type oligopeptide transport system substrate-binding subunit
MWHSNLGIETEIVLKNWDEYEQQMRAGDYDIVRRSIVMQTTDEATNLLAMFALPEASGPENSAAAATPSPEHASGKTETGAHKETAAQMAVPPITTEQQALHELPAMPLYFASSYALVKPYVNGFDANLLDAPSLQRVQLDADWQPPNVSSQ